MKIEYQIILKENLTESHRMIFAQLLKEQGKVKGDLTLKADRCKMICLVFINKNAVAIGGIKVKTLSDFSANKANLPKVSKHFKWELGYIYTNPSFTQRGIASKITNLLLSEYGNENLMASTEITANPGMVKILERNGFKHYGTPWKSGIHSDYLGLFLKYN